MAVDVTKSVKVTFANGLPMGTRGTFTYEKELWIAYPAKKNQQLFSVTNRMLNIYDAITDDMIRWINERPGDTDLVLRVMERVGRAREFYNKLLMETIETRTS